MPGSIQLTLLYGRRNGGYETYCRKSQHNSAKISGPSSATSCHPCGVLRLPPIPGRCPRSDAWFRRRARDRSNRAGSWGVDCEGQLSESGAAFAVSPQLETAAL